MKKKQERLLTKILQGVGDEPSPDSPDETKSQVVAAKLWNLACSGKLSFADTAEDSGVRVLKASVKDWRDTVQWIYTHVDGPFKPIPTEGEGLVGELGQTPLAELQRIVRLGAETMQESTPTLSDE